MVGEYDVVILAKLKEKDGQSRVAYQHMYCDSVTSTCACYCTLAELCPNLALQCVDVWCLHKFFVAIMILLSQVMENFPFPCPNYFIVVVQLFQICFIIEKITVHS